MVGEQGGRWRNRGEKNKRRRSPRGRYGAKQQRAGDKGWGGAGGLFEIGGVITRSC